MRQLKKIGENKVLQKDEKDVMTIGIGENLFIKVVVLKIPGNGSCLFGAIYQQLNNVSVNSPNFNENVKLLRQSVIKHIQERRQIYLNQHPIPPSDEERIDNKPFEKELMCSAADKFNTTFETVTETMVDIYLDTVMPLPDTWGGSETIKAAIEIFDINVLTFTEEAKKHNYYHFDKNRDKTVLLAYRRNEIPGSRVLYNHYDSVFSLPDSSTVEKIARKMIADEQTVIKIGNFKLNYYKIHYKKRSVFMSVMT